jgi:probable phosphoglycerate mutase
VNRPELWLVRHGETAWSRDRRHTGRTDVPLTPQGQEAARALAPRLARARFDLVLTSPLTRAADTARLAGFGTARVVDEAVEWDYGDYEGITTGEIRETEPGWTVWTHGVPGGETADQVGARADRVIALVREAGVERALLFSHAHLLRVLAARWIGLPAVNGGNLLLDTATVSILGWEREDAAIRRWNA